MAEPPVRRNTILLSASLAANSAMLQLSAAVATLTVVLVVGVRSLVGLGPAIVLGTGALSALPAGRAMDRFGRVPVLVDRLRSRDRGRHPGRCGRRVRPGRPGARRTRVRRRRERDGAPRAHRRGRHVSAEPSRARDLVRPLRRRLRRHPRPNRLQPAPRRQGPRRRRARAPLARRIRVHGPRPRARRLRTARPEQDRENARRSRARRRACGEARRVRRHPPPAGRPPVHGRRHGELFDDGR